MTDPPRRPAPQAVDPQLLTTYRYLRMSLITLLALLASGVVVQAVAAAPEPLLTSISAYYWTPVRSVFVGSLVAVGVGMVVLKADNEVEDIFLNIGGILAPVVAFVPVPDFATCVDGTIPAESTLDGIANNVGALLVAGLVGFAIFLGLVRAGRTQDARPHVPRPIRIARMIGLAATVVVFLAGAVWFLTARVSFGCHGHDTAAIILFGCIVAVTALNGVSRALAKRAHGRSRAVVNAYTLITAGMVAVLVSGLLLYAVWDYAILYVEAGVLALFLAFWVVQSRELWVPGVRHAGRGTSLFPRAPD